MSRQSPGLPIPDDWDGSTWTRFSICWPNSLNWRAILAGFLTTPMMGRTWDGDTGSIVDVQQVGREIFESNLDWRYCVMSSCDETGLQQLIDAINSIAVKITGGGGCGCGIGAGGVGPGGGPIIEPAAADTPGGGEVPAGFPEGYSYGDYLAYKCRAANKIADDLIASCAGMSSLGGVVAGVSAAALYVFVNTSLLSGLLVGVMAIGFSAATSAAIVIAAIIALIGLGAGGLAYFADLHSGLVDGKDDLVCLLYSSNSVEGARADLGGFVDGIVEGISGIDEFASDKLNSVVMALTGNAVLNLLFQYDAGIAEYVGDDDCSGCSGPGLRVNVVYGTGGPDPAVIDGQLREYVSEVEPSTYSSIQFQDDAGNGCQDYDFEFGGFVIDEGQPNGLISTYWQTCAGSPQNADMTVSEINVWTIRARFVSFETGPDSAFHGNVSIALVE